MQRSRSSLLPDLELGVPPGQLPQEERQEYANKELPPIPPKSPGRVRAGSDPQLDHYRRPLISLMKEAGSETDIGLRKRRSKRVSAIKILSPPPKPPMSKSAQKIMQLTGHDASFDLSPKTPSTPRYAESVHSLDSAGSVYSQETQINQAIHAAQSWGASGPVSPNRSSSSSKAQPTYQKLFNDSDIGSNRSLTPSPAVSLRLKDRVPRTDSPLGRIHDNASLYTGLVDEERAQYDRVMSKILDHYSPDEYANPHPGQAINLDGLAPKPLALRPKVDQTSPISPSAPGFRAGAQYRQSGMLSYQQPLPPTSPFREPIRPQNARRKRNFASGAHPLKSPFPFSPTQMSPGGDSFGSKLSVVMKRFSAAAHSPVKDIIPNRSRDPYGPDTPLPKNPGFMGIMPSSETIEKGKVHFQEVAAKAKKVLDKDERKRANLKKSIAVIGVTDQTPGRSNSWLRRSTTIN